MGKHSDWSGVTEILGRAATELRREVKGIARERGGDVRENLAGAVDNIADKIRASRGSSVAASRQSDRGFNALPILLGLGALVGVALMASDHKSSTN